MEGVFDKDNNCLKCKKPISAHVKDDSGPWEEWHCPAFDFKDFLKSMAKQARDQGFGEFADMVEKDAEKQNPFGVGEKK